jgi:hypothetical protein
MQNIAGFMIEQIGLPPQVKAPRWWTQLGKVDDML